MSRSRGSRKSSCCAKNFHPAAKTGALEVCKRASLSVPVGTPFEFTVEGGAPFIIQAGPGLDGNCESGGSFPIGAEITVQETVPGPGGSGPESIVVDPPANEVSTDLFTGIAVVRITAGTTRVTYTNIGGE